ncbi:NAD(P)H-quinone oxidoreductase [Leucobacter sp. CSA1]|uniref:NAD(P)H-quinone oxidoreductase n=1 Tax=Leucobacter chromiisoli TaxID=2796471 RepID=A0A934Q5B2_9MICO|nr:NAD(P)H-quinone oxidoreductase [Leucobacter chromiisoli]MBK0417908.1 NAD(P)H-quinone oxidoreductase [Leucobacter chromiisoli]
MRAVEFDTPGAPEVLYVAEVPEPQCGPGEVLIEVAAAGMNYADLLQRRGTYGLKPGAIERLGLECSGRIVDVGAEVPGLRVGDEVCALLAGGAYAERVAVDASLVLPKPRGVDLVGAAALPEMAATVWSNLVDIGGLRGARTVLVHGGGGGIGSGAIQVAKAFGARVITTCGSEEKAALCRELGADVVVNYREEDFVDVVREETGGAGVDLILDNMSALYLGRNVAACGMDSRIVMIGLQGGKIAEVDLGEMMEKRMSLHVTSLRDRPLAERARILRGVREDFWPLIEEGRLRPVVDRVFPIDEAVAAHAHAESGAQRGKVLIRLGE